MPREKLRIRARTARQARLQCSACKVPATPKTLGEASGSVAADIKTLDFKALGCEIPDNKAHGSSTNKAPGCSTNKAFMTLGKAPSSDSANIATLRFKDIGRLNEILSCMAWNVTVAAGRDVGFFTKSGFSSQE
uniref:Uncharacterized protein n=1 Tax=Kalanchoe fedtschenkoi TaxID=63787 RepID=A0A7N0TG67_KALFE